MWLRIESFQNRRIKEAVALRKSDERRKTGRIIIDGVREIGRALEAGGVIEEVFYCPTLAPEKGRQLVDVLAARNVTILEVPKRLFEKIAYGEREEGVVAVARCPTVSLEHITVKDGSEAPLLLVVEGIEKPGNLGAMIRTADGAGVTGVIAADLRCDMYNPAAIRASLGTIFCLPVVAASSAEVLEFLQQHALKCVAARVDGTSAYFEEDLTGPVAIVLGSEAEGLSPAWRQDWVKSVRIPMLGRADSLNVSVAAAVLLYEARRQRMVAAASRQR